MTIRIIMTPDGPKTRLSTVGSGCIRLRLGPVIVVLSKWHVSFVKL